MVCSFAFCRLSDKRLDEDPVENILVFAFEEAVRVEAACMASRVSKCVRGEGLTGAFASTVRKKRGESRPSCVILLSTLSLSS